jgi:glycosyltransferase involved in cell wall biosynthesis
MISNVSVAMATYNGSKFITEQLMSILAQTIFPSEIIIVDDASTDDTVDLIRLLQIDYPVIQLYCNEQNLGPVGSFKKALIKSNAHYIALADQDDIWLPNKLELSITQLSKTENEHAPSMVYTDLEVINTDGTFRAASFWKLQGYRPNKVSFQDIVIGNVVTGCTILMNRAMLAEAVKMPHEVAMHDHWMALIAYGFGQVQAIDKTTMKYRVHESSVTNKSKTTFFQRVSLFSTAMFDNKRLYLKNNIIQANAYLNLYGHRLSETKVKELKAIASLKYRTSWYRKLYIGMVKYL